jgi:hypothetical protein
VGWKDGAPPSPLRPSLGGSPTAASIRHRDGFVDRMLEALGAGESLVVTAEKRVGKTAAMRVLVERSTATDLIRYRDVEAVGTPKRLVELVTQDVLPCLGGLDRAKARFLDFFRKAGGTTVGSFSLPDFDERDWKSGLNEMFDALGEHLAEEGASLVLIWDEAPWMVAKMRDTCGWETAADLLDELRAIRDRHPRIRFVFTGSIGFHHVLRDLRDGKSHRSSINTMRQLDLPPLSPADAGRLAWALLGWIEERGATCTEPAPDLAERVAQRCDGLPYFIHATVDALAHRSALTVDDVDAVIEAARFSPNDPWNLAHYETRLHDYYGPDAELAGLVLDAIAVRDVARLDDIVGDLSHAGPGLDAASVLPILDLLHSDHYLARDRAGWRFTYGLIRATWLDRRNLRAAAP